MVEALVDQNCVLSVWALGFISRIVLSASFAVCSGSVFRLPHFVIGLLGIAYDV